MIEISIKVTDSRLAGDPLAVAWCRAYERKLKQLLLPQFEPIAQELDWMEDNGGHRCGSYFTMMAKLENMNAPKQTREQENETTSPVETGHDQSTETEEETT